MLKIFTFNLLLILIFSSLNSFSQDINNEPCSSYAWSWAHAIISEESYGNKDIASDKEGNLFATGSFSGKLALGVANYESKGGSDIYLVKYAPSGLILWTVVVGSKGYDEVMAVLPDHKGNVFLTGSFMDTLKIQDQEIVSSSQSSDIFVAKFDVYGDLVWLRRHGGSGYDHPGDLAIDDKGNLYLSGGFEGTAEIGGSLISSATKGNGFLLKFNSSGRKIWLRQFGNVAPLNIKLGVNANNHIIVGGTFSNTLTIQKEVLEGDSDNAVFLACFATNGKLRWLKKVTGGETSSSLATVAVDGHGALYIGGSFFGDSENTVFKVGKNTYQGSGGFLAKFNANGSPTWSRRISSGLFNYVSDIAIDRNNSVFATGLLTNSLEFGGKSFDGFGGFIAKYDQDGEPLKFWSTGNFSYEYTNFITADSQGNLYCTGLFEETAAFGKNNLTAEGGYNDAYIAKLNSTTPLLASEPDAKASSISFTQISATSVEASWASGDGVRRLVVVRKMGDVDGGMITDGILYHAGNGAYGKGSKLGARQYVVYNGTGNTAMITGLIPKIRYSVAVIEYNEEMTCPNSVNYKTDQFAMAYFDAGKSKALADKASSGKAGYFNIYPNPVDEKMNIILSSTLKGKREFSLFDQRGKLLHQFSANITNEVTRFSVNLSNYNLKSGIYFLKVKDEKMNHDTYRIIKK